MGQCDTSYCQKADMAEADAYEIGYKSPCSQVWCFYVPNGTCEDYTYNFVVVAGKGGYIYLCTNKTGGGVGEVTITEGGLHIGLRECRYSKWFHVYRLENPSGGFYFGSGSHSVTVRYCNNSGVNHVYHSISYCSEVGYHPSYKTCPNRLLEMLCTPEPPPPPPEKKKWCVHRVGIRFIRM